MYSEPMYVCMYVHSMYIHTPRFHVPPLGPPYPLPSARRLTGQLLSVSVSQATTAGHGSQPASQPAPGRPAFGLHTWAPAQRVWVSSEGAKPNGKRCCGLGRGSRSTRRAMWGRKCTYSACAHRTQCEMAGRCLPRGAGLRAGNTLVEYLETAEAQGLRGA